jgi:hypothetical protein
MEPCVDPNEAVHHGYQPKVDAAGARHARRRGFTACAPLSRWNCPTKIFHSGRLVDRCVAALKQEIRKL